MSNDVRFTVRISDLIVDAEQLSELVEFLNTKKFLDKNYRGKGNGFGGSEYEYGFVDCDANGRIEIKPLPENIWLYLNTFGKDK